MDDTTERTTLANEEVALLSELFDVSRFTALTGLIEQIVSEREKALRAQIGAEVEAYAAATVELADTIDGDNGVEHNEGCEGEPTCLACIVLDLRRITRGESA